MSSVSSKVIAACFALAAFAVAILAGLSANAAPAQVLWRAVVAMFVCYPVGLIAGVICHRVVEAHVAAHKAANPSPASDAALDESREPQGANEEPIVV